MEAFAWAGEEGGAPGDLEDAQEPHTAQDWNAQRGHDLRLHQDCLQDATAHHEAVEAVEEGHEVGLQAKAVHLQQHLAREQSQQHLVGDVWGTPSTQLRHNLRNYKSQLQPHAGTQTETDTDWSETHNLSEIIVTLCIDWQMDPKTHTIPSAVTGHLSDCKKTSVDTEYANT